MLLILILNVSLFLYGLKAALIGLDNIELSLRKPNKTTNTTYTNMATTTATPETTRTTPNQRALKTIKGCRMKIDKEVFIYLSL